MSKTQILTPVEMPVEQKHDLQWTMWARADYTSSVIYLGVSIDRLGTAEYFFEKAITSFRDRVGKYLGVKFKLSMSNRSEYLPSSHSTLPNATGDGSEEGRP